MPACAHMHHTHTHLEFPTALLIREVFGVAADTDALAVRVERVDLKLRHDRILAALQSQRNAFIQTTSRREI